MTSKCITGKVTNALFFFEIWQTSAEIKAGTEQCLFTDIEHGIWGCYVAIRKSQRKIEPLARPGYNKKIGAETLNLSWTL